MSRRSRLAMQTDLFFEQGPLAGLVIPIQTGQSLRIGRASDSDIVLPNRSVSRRHALVWREGNAVWIRDTESMNGTWVNGRRIGEPYQLLPGDRIHITSEQVLFRQGGALTESQWSTALRPEALLREMHRRLGERKLWLFAAACIRQTPTSWANDCSWLLEQLERTADQGLLRSFSGLRAGLAGMVESSHHLIQFAEALFDIPSRFLSAGSSAEVVWQVVPNLIAVVSVADESQQRSWIRELAGNPYRPAVLDPTWLGWNDGCVGKLARVLDAERRFEDLPILADALEDAGCTETMLLEHLRSSGPHCHGCWALDTVLGRQSVGS